MADFYAQFGRPVGFPGWLAGKLMASREGNKRRNAWTVDLLDIQPTDLVLEIGYGPGLGVEWAVAKVTNGLVVGFDHSDVMHGQARRRNQRAIELGHLLLRTGPLEAAAELGLRFDKAFCCNVAQFWPDPNAALAQFKALLKPGGRLAITYQPAGHGAKPADADRFAERWRGLLHAGGFRDVQVERLADLKPRPAVCLLAYA
ncbi:SAM-dependent methyltransferase [Caulobacter ginsengisoli]|uniref:SAM-dependent methyltransferase n=1 Tax=Caulobacter ginsengisoli TaxID=400775 RepID=A0ABU0IQM1_9CAUL|nr:class I SAM-dependent methyltransferase [Caulobacter ginsengisoli]MDQ0463247.1 SAM-dependent methyltransferase [Caulobacter ginsengisoli]